MDGEYYGAETEFNISIAPQSWKWLFRDVFLILKGLRSCHSILGSK
jgi:hypothetical protein